MVRGDGHRSAQIRFHFVRLISDKRRADARTVAADAALIGRIAPATARASGHLANSRDRASTDAPSLAVNAMTARVWPKANARPPPKEPQALHFSFLRDASGRAHRLLGAHAVARAPSTSRNRPCAVAPRAARRRRQNPAWILRRSKALFCLTIFAAASGRRLAAQENSYGFSCSRRTAKRGFLAWRPSLQKFPTRRPI